MSDRSSSEWTPVKTKAEEAAEKENNAWRKQKPAKAAIAPANVRRATVPLPDIGGLGPKERNLDGIHKQVIVGSAPIGTTSTSAHYAQKAVMNPLVPAGMLATTLALVFGLSALKRRDSLRQQFFMRARVGAQFFTICALIGGVLISGPTRPSEPPAPPKE